MGLQGISARAMASICVHRAPRPPPDSTPGHIRSRDVLLEDHRPVTDLPHKAVKARLEPGPTLSCNSSVTAIAIPRGSRAYPLARWHRFVSIERREPLQTALQGTSAHAMFCWDNTERLDVLQEDRRNFQMMFAGRTPKITDEPDYIQEGHGPVYKMSFTSL